MTHEAGIEAACQMFWEMQRGNVLGPSIGAAIQAYLSASGMVIVPKRPNEKMIAEAWSSWKSRNPKPIGPGPGFVEAISAAISAAPDPFKSKP